MKTAKRVIAAALSLLLILTLSATAFADTADDAEYRVTQGILLALNGLEGAEYTVLGVEETETGLEYERVKIVYQGNLSDYRSTLYMDCDEDGEEVMLYLFQLIRFREVDREALLLELNDLNAEYKGVKFYLDEKQDSVTAEYYLPTTEKTAADAVLRGLKFMIGITDEAYETVLADYAA